MHDDVRAAESPAEYLLDFLQSTYEGAASLGSWDRQALERPSQASVVGEQPVKAARAPRRSESPKKKAA